MSVAPPSLPSSGGNTGLANGLVSYWKLDDASGTTAADSVGSNTGTWHGTLGSQWTTGKINGGGSFNGTDNYVLIPNIATLNFNSTGKMSILAWVRPNGQASGNSTRDTGNIIRKDNDYGLVITNSNNVLFGNFNTPNTTTPAALSLNTWHHVVSTYDKSLSSGNVVIYVDGAAVVSQTNTAGIPSTGDNVAIGSGLVYGNQHYWGNIDEVGLWNRALSASEVATLYNAGSGDHYGGACGFDH